MRPQQALLMLSLTACYGLAFAADMGAAPPGDPQAVALKVIRTAEQPCPKIMSAKRLGDGSVLAKCNNGEDYRIFSVNGQQLAMKCSAARKMGIAGAC